MYRTLFQRFDNCAVIIISKKNLSFENEPLVYKFKAGYKIVPNPKFFHGVRWVILVGGGGGILGYAPSKCSILAGGIYHRISTIRFETNWFN